jgi:hypothetical protein
MTKRVAAYAVAACLAVFGSASLAFGAGGAAKHHFKLTEHSAVVSEKNGFPAPGGKAVFAGRVLLKIGGKDKRGADIRNVEITSASGNKVEFKGSNRVYGSNGSVKSDFRGETTVKPDGSTSHRVSGHVVGGTASTATRVASGAPTGRVQAQPG